MKENKTPVKAVLGALIYRFRIPVLAAVLIICALCMVFLKDVKLDEDPMASMYPDRHPFLKGLKPIEKMAPRTNMLVCLLETKNGDIYNTAAINKIDEVTKSLMDCEVINPTSVTSLTKGMDNYIFTANGLNIASVMGSAWPETPEQFKALRERVATNPMGPGKYVSYDGRAAMITANLMSVEQMAQSTWQLLDDKQKDGRTFEEYQVDAEGEFDPKMMKKLDELKKKVNDENFELLFMGEEVIKADMTKMGMTQMPVAGGLMFVLMIAMVAVYFRSWQAVLISIIVAIFPAGAGLGLFSLLGRSLNPMAVLFPLTVSVTSVAATVLIMDGYYRAVAEGSDRISAIIASWGKVPAGLAIAAISFLALFAAKVLMLRELGILGAISLAMVIAVTCLAVPAIASILPQPKNGPRSWEGISSALSPAAGMRYLAVAVLIALFALGVFSVYTITPGDNTPGSSYLWCSNQWNKAFNLFTEKFMGPNQLLVYVKAKKEGGLCKPEALNDISAFSNFLKYRAGAKDSIAFDYMIEMARYTMSDGSPKWQTLPETDREGKGLGGTVTENSDVKEFIDTSYMQASISPFFPRRDKASIDEYAELMQEYIDSHPSESLEFSLGGGLLGMVKMINDGVEESFKQVLVVMAIIILIFSVLLLRSFKTGIFYSVIVMISGMAVSMKLLFLGMPLSMPFAAVAAAGTGAAVVIVSKALDRTGTGVILFASMLVLLMCLPWLFIGMRFQALMIMGFAVTAISGGIFAMIFLPVLFTINTEGAADNENA
jgi:predicted RND superfamily exporter protein